MRKRGIFAVALPAVAVGAAAVAVAAGSPSVTTTPATGVTDTAATLHGTVNPEGAPTQYAFQYGTTTLYGRETPLTSAGSGTTAAAVQSTVTGLVPGTTYHFRTIAISAGGTATGNDETLKTTGTAPTPPANKPVASTGSASAVTSSSATVSGTVNPEGAPTTYYVEFGPTAAYGFQTTPQSAGTGSAPVTVTAKLTALQANSTYHYRVVAQNAGGESIGSDAQFSTSRISVTSKLALFGHTGFVSPSGIAGVLAGCLGDTNCTGASLTVMHNGIVIGRRTGDVNIPSQSGGVIHVVLNATGQRLLAQSGHITAAMRLTGANGQTSTGATDNGGVYDLYHFGG